MESKKSVWLKEDTVLLLALARKKFVNQYPKIKPYDDNVIKEALEVYVNE